jgi:transposase
MSEKLESRCFIVKLKLRPAQERQLARWLHRLTGVYNWAIRKIENDRRGGIYYSRWRLESLVAGHGAKIGVSQHAVDGAVRTAHMAWDRCFRKLGGAPKLKGRRNRLNSIYFTHTLQSRPAGKLHFPVLGTVRYHAQAVPSGHIGCARLVRRPSGWYAALFVKVPLGEPSVGTEQIGIDPGFSHLLTLSTGEKIEHPHELRRGELRLAQSQRGSRRRLTARLLERLGNRRRDRNHKLSRRLVQRSAVIAWSADRSRQIARTFGKSVTSAGHYQLRSMLAYKSRSGGVRFVEVASRNSTRICSACGAKSGPTGWTGLKVRHWACATCGVEHDRDVNAAVNMLHAGLGTSHERRRQAASGIATIQDCEVHS